MPAILMKSAHAKNMHREYFFILLYRDFMETLDIFTVKLKCNNFSAPRVNLHFYISELSPS